ncbi:MAG: SGNH/GDSL hydrolase family protein [Ferruginibacter sp.]
MKNMLTRLFILLVAFYFVSCKKNNANVNPVNPPLTTGMKTYLALGDSYTIGQSVAEADRFPNKTVAILNNLGKNVSAPTIIATTGWTTTNLLATLQANPPSTNYSFVTLLIGVNNQFQGKSLDEYKTEFALLLQKAIQYAGGKKDRVFILSIPDYSVTPFAQNSDTARIAREIDEFNAANKSITLSNGVKYLDITPISREGRSDNTLQANDGLHPSGKQYQRWADLLAPLIAAVL